MHCKQKDVKRINNNDIAPAATPAEYTFVI